MFLGIVSYGDLIFQLTVSAPLQLFYLFLLTRIIEISRKGVFWSCEIFISVVLMSFRMAMPIWFRVFLMIVSNFLLPIGLSKGSLVFRALISMVGIAFSTLSEGVLTLSFLFVTGASALSDLGVGSLNVSIFVAPFAFYFALLVGLLALAVMFGALRFVVAKFGFTTPLPGGVTGEFAPVFIVAAQFTVFFFILSWCFLLMDSNFVSAAGALVVAVAMASAVLALFVTTHQYAAERTADLRAEALQAGVESRLASYGRMVEHVENVARVRHDLRNQAQAALLAADAGERERARAQVAEMLDVARGADRLYARADGDEGQR